MVAAALTRARVRQRASVTESVILDLSTCQAARRSYRW
jgi:hypothetical protein